MKLAHPLENAIELIQTLRKIRINIVIESRVRMRDSNYLYIHVPPPSVSSSAAKAAETAAAECLSNAFIFPFFCLFVVVWLDSILLRLSNFFWLVYTYISNCLQSKTMPQQCLIEAEIIETNTRKLTNAHRWELSILKWLECFMLSITVFFYFFLFFFLLPLLSSLRLDFIVYFYCYYDYNFH